MGVSFRVFLVDDTDSLQRIPMTRLDRLLHFDSLSQRGNESFGLQKEIQGITNTLDTNI
jgi:hypothetical protein